MKGIILAGGDGTRLAPLTTAISKQLLPVYNKPMIYYSLSVLMLANIRDILMICTEQDLPRMKLLLGCGGRFGININYLVQNKANGIAECFLLGESFIGCKDVALILGDNLFFSEKLIGITQNLKNIVGAHIFTYRVNDPAKYGVAEIKNNEVIAIYEKPQTYISDQAVTGLYFYDNSVIQKAKQIQPSKRGELEITDIHNLYIKESLLTCHKLCRNAVWFDAGDYDSLLEASLYIKAIEQRQNIFLGSIESIGLEKKWISKEDLLKNIHMKKDAYSEKLRKYIHET